MIRLTSKQVMLVSRSIQDYGRSGETDYDFNTGKLTLSKNIEDTVRLYMQIREVFNMTGREWKYSTYTNLMDKIEKELGSKKETLDSYISTVRNAWDGTMEFNDQIDDLIKTTTEFLKEEQLS